LKENDQARVYGVLIRKGVWSVFSLCMDECYMNGSIRVIESPRSGVFEFVSSGLVLLPRSAFLSFSLTGRRFAGDELVWTTVGNASDRSAFGWFALRVVSVLLMVRSARAVSLLRVGPLQGDLNWMRIDCVNENLTEIQHSCLLSMGYVALAVEALGA
jgi:hypothetical protein